MKKSGFIAILGRPNAGKSTLLNAILGESLSIVTPKAQTTREQVKGIYSAEEGQLVFLDTPGIHKAKEGGLNAAMMVHAREALEGAHLIWYLVDPDTFLEHEQTVIDLLAKNPAPIFIVLNKCDLKKNASTRLDPLQASLQGALEKKGLKVLQTFKISAYKKKGIQELIQASWEQIPEGEAFFPDSEQLSDRPMRFFVGELIREQLYLQLGEELPYSCAVEIENFDEKSKPIRIEASIHVERASQQGMVVGKGGQKIKMIGMAARKKIEHLVGAPVFLKLQVKLLKDWTRNSKQLEKMGFIIHE